MDSRNAQAFFTIANEYKNKRSGLQQSQSIMSTKSKHDTKDTTTSSSVMNNNIKKYIFKKYQRYEKCEKKF